MSVSLTPEIEARVADRLKRGTYTSATEVLDEALRLLEARDAERDARLDEFRAKVQTGLDQLDRGEFTEGGPEFFESVKQRGRERAELRAKE